jgi:hypothetical protein
MKYLAFTYNGQHISAPGGIPDGGGLTTLLGSGSAAFTITFTVAFLIALFFMIWAGIQWTMSGGDKAKIQAARNRITYAIAGIILLVMAFFIVNLVGHLFNVKLF